MSTAGRCHTRGLPHADVMKKISSCSDTRAFYFLKSNPMHFETRISKPHVLDYEFANVLVQRPRIPLLLCPLWWRLTKCFNHGNTNTAERPAAAIENGPSTATLLNAKDQQLEATYASFDGICRGRHAHASRLRTRSAHHNPPPPNASRHRRMRMGACVLITYPSLAGAKHPAGRMCRSLPSWQINRIRRLQGKLHVGRAWRKVSGWQNVIFFAFGCRLTDPVVTKGAPLWLLNACVRRKLL